MEGGDNRELKMGDKEKTEKALMKGQSGLQRIKRGWQS